MSRPSRRRVRRVLAALTAAGLAGLGAGAATAAETPSLDIVAVDSSRSPDVTLTVTPPGALAETPLPAEAFALRENGTLVPVEVARPGTAAASARASALEVVLVVDTSGSMKGEAMAAARSAATAFVRGMPAGTRVAVVAFGTRPVVAGSMSPDLAHAVTALAGLDAAGETALYDAVHQGLTLFSPSGSSPSGRARRAMVVLSDGGDTASAATLESTVATLAPAGVEFVAVELVTDEHDGRALRALGGPGGAIVSVDDPAHLAAGYRDVATDLFNRYEVTYRTLAGSRTDVALSIRWDGVTDTVERSVVLPELSGLRGEAPAPSVNEAPGLLGSQGALYPGLAAAFAGLAVLLGKLLTGERQPRVRLSERFGGGRSGERFRAVTDLAERAAVAADERLERSGRASRLNALLERAGIDLRPGEYVVLVGGVAAGALLLGALLFSPLGGIVLGGAAVGGGVLVTKFKAARRRNRFAEQLPDTLQLVTGSLRAGHSILQSMDSVANDAPSPTREEFRRLLVETRLGRELPDALNAMHDRVGNVDFQWFVQALAIHREVGGDLAEILDTVARTVRDRAQVRRHVRTLSAEGRMSAVVLFALPIGIMGVMRLLNPGYLDTLFSTGPGLVMVAAACVLMTAGFFWLRRMIRLEF